jgi:hypothetical protein
VAASPLRSFRTLAFLTALAVAIVMGWGVFGVPREPSFHLDDSDAASELNPSDPAVAFGLQITETRSEWLADFVARGRDPRELPPEMLEVDYWGPPMTLARAQREARYVVQGQVLTTTYVSDVRSMGFPYSIATLQVERVVKGQISMRTIEVLQSGGPEWDPEGGKLWQIPGDPLLFPGDHVILLLIPALAEEQRALGRYQTVYQAGVYLITEQGVFASGSNTLAGLVSGHSASRVLELFD